MTMYYSQIFPVQEAAVNFLKESFSKGKILDIGCAVGDYTNALKSNERTVIGIDPTVSFIEEAKRKYSTVEFKIDTMQFVEDVVDGIYCIGNTLAHVKDENDLKDTLEHFSSLLKEEGTLVLGFINYSYIYEHFISELPLIEKEGLQFKRSYDREQYYVNFKTTLTVEEHSESDVQRLYALPIYKVIEYLEEVGFKEIEVYASYSKANWNIHNDQYCVLRMKKGTL